MGWKLSENGEAEKEDRRREGKMGYRSGAAKPVKPQVCQVLGSARLGWNLAQRPDFCGQQQFFLLEKEKLIKRNKFFAFWKQNPGICLRSS